MEATRKLISKSGEVFASPVTYLASYVIPTEKRTLGELQTLNEILKLGGGGSGEKTKGDTTLNESNAVLGLRPPCYGPGTCYMGILRVAPEITLTVATRKVTSRRRWIGCGWFWTNTGGRKI